MKKPTQGSAHRRLVLARDVIRTLSTELPRVVGGYTEDGANGDNTACTGNDTGCGSQSTAIACAAPDR
jgi:hypothetical protein